MKGIYEKIAAITDGRKEKRHREIERRKREVFAVAPKIQEIEEELDRFGIRMLNLIASGKCDSDKATSSIIAENKAFIKERDRLLSQAGFPSDYLDVQPVCEKCDDSGFIDGKLCSCIQSQITQMALSEANLSENLAGHTFENFKLSYYSDDYVEEYGCSPRENMKAILNDCKAFVENFDKTDENLLFCGSCGLGKTFLSSAIANELIKKGKDVLYVSSNALFPILEDMHFGRQVDESAQYIVKKIGETELLILDDLGSEFVTQFTCAELFRIINTRLNADRKMIISTNLNRNMLQNTYNERIASRITGGFSMLEFLGDDIRRIKKLEGKM